MPMQVLAIHFLLLPLPFVLAKLMPQWTDAWYIADSTKKKDFHVHFFAPPNINASI
jgi:hypothetical protein